MRNVNLEKWRGRRDPVAIDPDSTPFRVLPATNRCRGCAFDGQWSPVCRRAGELAVAAGWPDCESGVIYVTGDPRQLNLLKE